VILWEYRNVLLQGTLTTLWISWLALIVAGVLGAVVGYYRTSVWWWLRASATIYTEFFRSIPTLVQLFFVYFGITFIFSLDLSPFAAATIALGLEGSALMSEVVRSGLQSVGKGQIEAARSTGLSGWQTNFYVVWPQAIRVMIPPAVSIYVSTLKASSLASVIGFVELTKAGMLIRESHRGGMLILFAVAAIYIVVNYTISLIGSRLERRFSYAH
jgi:His/Glu/Gln/Arg/opine family amino acid ABC transporter permease subunit